MTFDTIAAGDIEIFLAEFGTEHTIDGAAGVVAVFDTDTLGAVARRDEIGNAVELRLRLLYVRAADLAKAPVIHRNMSIDNITYEVLDIADEAGMLKISLSRNVGL